MFIDLNEGHEGRVMTEEIDSPGDSSSRQTFNNKNLREITPRSKMQRLKSNSSCGIRLVCGLCHSSRNRKNL